MCIEGVYLEARSLAIHGDLITSNSSPLDSSNGSSITTEQGIKKSEVPSFAACRGVHFSSGITLHSHSDWLFRCKTPVSTYFGNSL
jgi:hypothetical protein